uniref:Uncharacterized protein n=1 Tax=Cajanus cajan TaxID=3821 RepID=A0A151SMW8_CAJCA|nr:hypothetical protein KK1_002404 [Cajanus cajan]
MVYDCNLVDMGFQGNPFTWKKGNLLERLDRVLANMEWKASQVHRPFCFEAAWLTHPELPNLIKASWNMGVNWNNNLECTQHNLTKWNQETFGNIFLTKRRILRRLNGIALKLEQKNNPYLENLSKELWAQYEEILSRCKWLEMGDCNTKYFHSTTIIRRRKNRILKLKNDGGIWIENKKNLELVTNFYKNLFKDPGVFTPFCLTGTFPELSSDDKKSLDDTFSDLEIMAAIQRMGGLKEPRPGGFQAIFYQTQRKTIGKSLCNLIRSIQEEPNIEKAYDRLS